MIGPAAQTQAPPGNSVLRLDPALDAISSPDAKLETLKADYFGFIEGPVWMPDAGGGYLLFSDIPANRVYKWDPKAGLSAFLENLASPGPTSRPRTSLPADD